MSGRRRRDYGSGSISQRKDGTWTARVVIGTNDNGTPKIKALYGKTEREVRKKLKEFQNELHKNDRIVVQKSTVESYMLNWLHSVKSNELKPKSFDRLEQTIKYQVVPYIGSLQVGAINADDVQKMLNDLKKEGKSYSTIKKAYDAVNECFRTGMIKKTVASNPVLGVSVPAKKTFAKTKVKCYTKEESEKLCQAAAERYKNGKPIYRLGGVVKLALNSGLRLGELLGLRWEDVSFDNRTITVAQTIVVVKNRDNKSEAKYLSVTQDSAKTQTSERTNLYERRGVRCSNKALCRHRAMYARPFRRIRKTDSSEIPGQALPKDRCSSRLPRGQDLWSSFPPPHVCQSPF